MAKYHVSPRTGDPKICKAVYSCPFGGEEDHYGSAEEAREAFEARMAFEAFTSHSKTEDDFFSREELDSDLLEEVRDNHGFITHRTLVMERDSSVYEQEVWRGREDFSGRYGSIELWHDEQASRVHGYVGVAGKEVKVFDEKYEEEFGNRERAVAFQTLFEKANTLHPEVFDSSQDSYYTIRELQRQVDVGSVEVGDFTLNRTSRSVPEIWETSATDVEGVSEVYVRVRHDHARATVVYEDGSTETVYAAEAPFDYWYNSNDETENATRAFFFAKVNDGLLAWEARRS